VYVHLHVRISGMADERAPRAGGRKRGSRLPRAVRTEAAVAAAAPELTRRQLEYWVEMGWVVPDELPRYLRDARGHPRSFSERELKILGVMYRLTVAGFPARNAAWIAREAVMQAERREPGALASSEQVRLVPGIRVVIDI
jgi:hypothetical protein